MEYSAKTIAEELRNISWHDVWSDNQKYYIPI